MTTRQCMFRLTTGLSILGTAALYQGLVLRKYHINTPKLAKRQLRFVLISDLHSIRYGAGQSKILTLIRDQKPDYILLAGDLADERRPVPVAKQFFRGVSRIAPSFYTTGNHEYRLPDVNAFRDEVKACGVSVLSDCDRLVASASGPIRICGIEDASIGRKINRSPSLAAYYRHIFRNISSDETFTIMVSHRPELIDLFADIGFDLVVSGHTHGGQVRVPFLINGLYASGQGLFPKLSGGMYKCKNTGLIISRGVAVYPFIPRIFNPPEIVVIDIN